jgi:hypothetical protein
MCQSGWRKAVLKLVAEPWLSERRGIELPSIKSLNYSIEIQVRC